MAYHRHPSPFIIIIIIALAVCCSSSVYGMHEDEAGLMDFIVKTAGHGYGGVTYAAPTCNGTLMITSTCSSMSPLSMIAAMEEEKEESNTKSSDFVVGSSSSSSSSVDSSLQSSCAVTARDVGTGQVRWRRNVCNSGSSSSNNVRHAVHVTNSVVYTLDDGGVFRLWDAETGSLLSDVLPDVPSSTVLALPRLHYASFGTEDHSLALATVTPLTSAFDNNLAVDGVSLRDFRTGSVYRLIAKQPNGTAATIKILSAEDMLLTANLAQPKHDAPCSARFLYMDTSGNSAIVLSFAWICADEHKRPTLASSVASVEIIFSATNAPTKSAEIGADGSVQTTTTNEAIDTPKLPTLGQVSILSDDDPTVEKIMHSFTDDDDDDDDDNDDKTVNCNDIHYNFDFMTSSSSYVSATNGNNVPLAVDDSDLVQSLANKHNLDTIQLAKVLHCSKDNNNKAMILLSTHGGTTMVLQVDPIKDGLLVISMKWMAEEALGSVTSALFLDEVTPRTTTTSSNDTNVGTNEGDLMHRLSMESRWKSQRDSILDFMKSSVSNMNEMITSFTKDASTITFKKQKNRRDYQFGFTKIALFVSSSMNRIMAIDTANDGELLWSDFIQEDNTKVALWHKLIRGVPSGRIAVSGGRGDSGSQPHGSHILVLSAYASDHGTMVGWKCMDGLYGTTFTTGMTSEPYRSNIAQIIPLQSTGSGDCHQAAAILLENQDVMVVPDTPSAHQSLFDAIRSSSSEGGNGIFTHSIDKSTGLFRSFRLVKTDRQQSLARAIPVGGTTFDPTKERIINVAYPQRSEVVQSPAQILGDDSLLLKYLNPHLAVIVTESIQQQSDKDDSDPTDAAFSNALASRSAGAGGEGGPKKKPLGVTKPGETAAAPGDASAVDNENNNKQQQPGSSSPSLFVTLVDAVSGKILYRTSHVDAVTSSSSFLPSVPVLVTENWVLYAFSNARSRRTEISVLTLHEGMIDKAGITPFSTPEQELSFSSLTSPKPIVLSKVYTLAKPVSALGVTNTRGGISSKVIVIATGVDGQVLALDRRMFDPRRPTGELKKHEKQEGLLKYAPLLPISSHSIPSYHLEVSMASQIISTSTNVESQSLVLAFGGPDIFFTRMAPSRGFDLLPDSFNRPLLTVVVIGLVTVVLVLHRISAKRLLMQGWS